MLLLVETALLGSLVESYTCLQRASLSLHWLQRANICCTLWVFVWQLLQLNLVLQNGCGKVASCAPIIQIMCSVCLLTTYFLIAFCCISELLYSNTSRVVHVTRLKTRHQWNKRLLSTMFSSGKTESHYKCLKPMQGSRTAPDILNIGLFPVECFPDVPSHCLLENMVWGNFS